MSKTVLAIVGSREMPYSMFNMLTAEANAMKHLFGEPDLIISGGAVGADTLAEQYAKERDIPFKRFPPDWKTFPRKKFKNRAYHARDKQIARECTHLLAFPSKRGRGTQLTVAWARVMGKVVYVVPID